MMGVKPLTEKGFMATVVQYAKLCGWMCYHTWNSKHSEPGFPDLVLVRDGEIVFVELKLEKGKVSVAQEKWLSELQKCSSDNVSVIVFRPSDWEEVKGTLK